MGKYIILITALFFPSLAFAGSDNNVSATTNIVAKGKPISPKNISFECRSTMLPGVHRDRIRAVLGVSGRWTGPIDPQRFVIYQIGDSTVPTCIQIPKTDALKIKIANDALILGRVITYRIIAESGMQSIVSAISYANDNFVARVNTTLGCNQGLAQGVGRYRIRRIYASANPGSVGYDVGTSTNPVCFFINNADTQKNDIANYAFKFGLEVTVRTQTQGSVFGVVTAISSEPF